MKKKTRKIRTFHLPHQRGKLVDYWVAMCDGDIEGAETEQEAIKRLLNKRKDLH